MLNAKPARFQPGSWEDCACACACACFGGEAVNARGEAGEKSFWPFPSCLLTVLKQVFLQNHPTRLVS